MSVVIPKEHWNMNHTIPIGIGVEVRVNVISELVIVEYPQTSVVTVLESLFLALRIALLAVVLKLACYAVGLGLNHIDEKL